MVRPQNRFSFCQLSEDKNSAQKDIAKMMDRFGHRIAEDMYNRFYGFAPDRAQIYRLKRVIPPVVVQLGELSGLIYRSDKWSPGQKRNFIHFMENPPKLVSNPEGSQLYILGGSYRITSRGIEG